MSNKMQMYTVYFICKLLYMLLPVAMVWELRHGTAMHGPMIIQSKEIQPSLVL